MDPVSLLIQIVIILLILGVIWFILDRFVPIDRQIKMVILAIFGVIAIIYLVRALRLL